MRMTMTNNTPQNKKMKLFIKKKKMWDFSQCYANKEMVQTCKLIESCKQITTWNLARVTTQNRVQNIEDQTNKQTKDERKIEIYLSQAWFDC